MAKDRLQKGAPMRGQLALIVLIGLAVAGLPAGTPAGSLFLVLAIIGVTLVLWLSIKVIRRRRPLGMASLALVIGIFFSLAGLANHALHTLKSPSSMPGVISKVSS